MQTTVHGALTYLEQDCPKTLQQALEEYFGTIDGLITAENTDAQTAELFRSHDICHVIFGCKTTPGGEALVDVWSWAGSTATASDLLAYAKNPAAKAIFREYGLMRSIWLTVKTIPRYFVLLWRAARMKKRWLWRGNEAYLSVPLVAIRQEFNIRVLPSGD